MSFSLANTLAALITAILTAVICFGTRRYTTLWRRLPRERVTGILIGSVCLIWSATYALPMLEGSLERYHIVIKILVPVTIVLSYLYLNFLFTRALGGFILLGSTYLLHAAFVGQAPIRIVYSLVCYSAAAGGVVLVAAPWYFRDLLEKVTTATRWRHAMTGILTVLALYFALYALI
ncbi:MAG: hypothetical protein K9N51_05765 [Candidatus Pacebacteria bacterium]|nr:hypothetical protein [Candidatus Paceibacterota bacterium]